MITDEEMIDLGFKKVKTYKKKKERGLGESKYCWLKDNCFILTIEKNLAFDDDLYRPTFKNFTYVWHIEHINDVKRLLQLLNLSC